MSRLLFAPPELVSSDQICAFRALSDHFFRLTGDPAGQVFHYDISRPGVHLVDDRGIILRERWNITCRQRRPVEVIDLALLGLNPQQFPDRKAPDVVIG